MKRYVAIAFLMSAAILAQVSTASAQRWGRGATPRSGVCFYEHINFDGRYFCTPTGTTMPEVQSGMNNQISSIRVFGNASVMVFRDPNLRGQSRFIDSDVPDLRGMGFNDRLSSYQVDVARGVSRGGSGNWYGYGNARPVQPSASRWSYGEAQSIVRRGYQSVLGRSPDPGGLRSWTDAVMSNNWSQRDLDNALRQSDEYRASRNNNGWGRR